MKPVPVVGLVVPTLGERPELLARTLASIQRQDGVDLRLAMVAPADRVDSLRTAHPEVEVVAEPGGGIASAIEAAWDSLGEVEYLAWLGDDDLLAPGALRTAAGALAGRPRASFAYGRCHYIDLDGAVTREIRPGWIAIPLLRLGQNTLAQPGALYRREAVDAIGGLDTDLRLAFDVDLHLRLAQHAPAVYVPRVLAAARAHPASLTTAQRDASQREADLVTSRLRSARVERARPLWDPLARQVTRVASKVSSRPLR